MPFFCRGGVAPTPPQGPRQKLVSAIAGSGRFAYRSACYAHRMAHFDKFTRATSGRLLAHDLRSLDRDGHSISYGTSCVDASRTHLNYRLDANDNPNARLTERLSEIKVYKRDDVKVLCSWIVTLPTDGSIKQDEERKFFESVHRFLQNKYGAENEICASVHLDETTPHLHYAFVPVVKDKKTGGEKCCANDLITKKHLQTFHTELAQAVSADFGGRRIGILKEETERLGKSQETYFKTVDELKAARSAVESKIEAPTLALTANKRRATAIAAAAEAIEKAAQLESERKRRIETEKKLESLKKKTRQLEKNFLETQVGIAAMRWIRKNDPAKFEEFKRDFVTLSPAERQKRRRAAGREADRKFLERLAIVQRREKALRNTPGLDLIVKRFGWGEETENYIRKQNIVAECPPVFEEKKEHDATRNEQLRRRRGR